MRAQLRLYLNDQEYAAAARSTINAHYTDAAIVQSIWAAVRRLGFTGGQVLEPGSGAGKFIGLAYYWDFEDRCWVISNMAVVERAFLADFVAAFELLFERDEEEYDSFKEHSVSMRRVFSRRRQPIVFIGREGGYFKELPHGRGIRPCEAKDLPKFGPYRSERAYARALKEAGATDPAPALAEA